MDTQADDGTLVEDMGAAIWQHKLLIAIVLVATVLTTYVALQLVSEEYESVARLLVKLGRENVEVPATVEKGGVLTTGVRKEEINSEVQLVQSRDLIEATLDEIGEDAFRFEAPPPTTLFERIKYEARAFVRSVRDAVDELLIAANLRKRLSPRDKVIMLLERSLTVERERDSDVISVRLRLPDPDLTVRVLNVLVRNYLDRHMEVRRDPSVSAFYAEQVERYRTRLREIGSSKQSVQSQRGIASVSDQRALLLRRLRSVTDDIQDLERERNVMLQRGAFDTRAPMNAAAAAPAPALPPAVSAQSLSSYPALDLLKKRLTELRIKYNELLQRYKPGSEAVASIESEIASVEALCLRTVESMLADRRPEVAALERELAQINAGERELDSVDQERQAAVQNFLVYSRRLEEARIADQLDQRRISNVGLLTAPERPIQPVYPRKLLIVGASIPVGLVLGLAFALLHEHLNQVIRSPRDLRRMGGVPYVGRLRLGRREEDARR
jgi:uncharacterized protein involved in exopolysaccharide biosynthesis